MNWLGRDLTAVEKILLSVLILILMGLAYYQFVDRPVRQGIEDAETECEKLELELAVIEGRIRDYYNRVDEIEWARELGKPMPSYNSSARELEILNSILRSSRQYSFSFDNITLDGNQIRRNFSLSFRAEDFDAVKEIFTRLSDSPIRCLIGDMKYGVAETEDGNFVSVKADGAFYETTVDSVTDAALLEAARSRTDADE